MKIVYANGCRPTMLIKEAKRHLHAVLRQRSVTAIVTVSEQFNAYATWQRVGTSGSVIAGKSTCGLTPLPTKAGTIEVIPHEHPRRNTC